MIKTTLFLLFMCLLPICPIRPQNQIMCYIRIGNWCKFLVSFSPQLFSHNPQIKTTPPIAFTARMLYCYFEYKIIFLFFVKTPKMQHISNKCLREIGVYCLVFRRLSVWSVWKCRAKTPFFYRIVAILGLEAADPIFKSLNYLNTHISSSHF